MSPPSLVMCQLIHFPLYRRVSACARALMCLYARVRACVCVCACVCACCLILEIITTHCATWSAFIDLKLDCSWIKKLPFCLVHFRIRRPLARKEPFHPISSRSVLMSSSHIRLVFPKRSSPLWFKTKILYVFLFSPFVPHVPATSSVLIWSPLWYFAENECNATCNYSVSSAFIFSSARLFSKTLSLYLSHTTKKKATYFFEGNDVFETFEEWKTMPRI